MDRRFRRAPSPSRREFERGLRIEARLANARQSSLYGIAADAVKREGDERVMEAIRIVAIPTEIAEEVRSTMKAPS